MTVDTERHYFRCVVCLHCKAPIPVPAIVGGDGATRREDEQAEWSQSNSRVFNLRCPSCYKEKPYRTREIVDFEGSPDEMNPLAEPSWVRVAQRSEISKTAKA